MIPLKFLRDFSRLSRKRLNSENDYLKFQEFQAQAIYQDLNKIFKLPHDSFVIDFGCGKGGYTNFFSAKFKKVLGIDFHVKQQVSEKNIFESHDLLNYKNPQKADLIFCSSVIEHVKNQEGLLKSINENLKSGGFLYLSFPPFYSLGGGHQLKPFHYFPEKFAIWMGKKSKRIDNQVSGYGNLFGSWGLYKTTINKVARLLTKNNFRILKCKTRFLPVNTANIPVLNELLTWHVEFYCQKP